MTRNQMPSASGVRIAGDDYQWLHAWRSCLEALHENFVGNNANPIVAVGVEESGVGNGDDVVLHRKQPPNTYTQVKYAVDNRTAVNLEYLATSGILRKMQQTYTGLIADGTPAEMRLITNRNADPNDSLVADRDGRDGRLVPRATQGGPNSDRGKARVAWAAEAQTDEEHLLDLLTHLHFDIAYDLDRLRRDVSLLMTANGLRSDPTAVELGADWVSKQVIAGHRRISLDDIKRAITTLGLHAGSPWTTISIATITHDYLAEQAAVSIDWVDRMSGVTDWTRVEPAQPASWNELATDIRSIPSRLGSNKRILVTGHMRQATGFLVGTELRRVKGYEVGVRQGDQLWTGEEQTTSGTITHMREDAAAAPGTAIIVNIAADAAADTIEWIRESALPVSEILTATPIAGVGPKAVPNAAAANSLAIDIRDLARRHARNGDLHLFLIGPLGVAVLLGHHWNRLTTTHVYEHLGGVDYTHAFTVEA
ncbi:SAVED domain-containing protein [Tsukamurella sputi]|uniref:SAVED domain-containing protein n=1 Tax=Tsukamurella sputi TaxID=2591848 RepID=A0A5C5RL29_9ACTN|nr:SAVED domain-containing protein [Tsukamurella sputi]TWS22795.1 SAVED domain-containing protein [Tsukamurella sputi]